MNRIQEITLKYDEVKKQMEDLHKEYDGKKKGDVFSKRKMAIEAKGRDLIFKAKNFGTTGTICHVRGRRSRPSIKNPAVLIEERFNFYLINVSQEEATQLIKLHIKNITTYTVTFIRPGMILKTS